MWGKKISHLQFVQKDEEERAIERERERERREQEIVDRQPINDIIEKIRQANKDYNEIMQGDETRDMYDDDNPITLKQFIMDNENRYNQLHNDPLFNDAYKEFNQPTNYDKYDGGRKRRTRKKKNTKKRKTKKRKTRKHRKY
jgi:hypothetical protein